MSTLLAKIRWGRSLGVHIARDRLVLTEVGATPVGVKVLAAWTIPVGAQGPGAALGDWLMAHWTLRQRRQSPICIGLPAEQVFFTTRRAETGEASAEPATLETLLASAAGSIDPAAAAGDFLAFKSTGLLGYSLAACRKELAASLLEAMRLAGVASVRLEPGPWPLLTLADRDHAPPKGWKAFVRVLLDESGGLAALVSAGRPLLWRRFAFGPNPPGQILAAAVRYLLVSAEGLAPQKVQGVMVQGDAAAELAAQLASHEAMPPVEAFASGPYGDVLASLAMALSARDKSPDAFDLLRNLRPRATLAQTFPRKLAAAMAAAVIALAGWLWSAGADAQDQCEALGRQNASHAWAATQKTADLEKEHKALSEEVAAIQKFLGTRVTWSDYLADLPTRLPPNACLQGIAGTYEFQVGNSSLQKKANRSLTLRGMARFVDHNSAPREIDALLESLRGMDLLKRDFPMVILAEIKWRHDVGTDVALFSIIAMPKVKAVAAAGDKADKEGS